jgi:hypothetical protein
MASVLDQLPTSTLSLLGNGFNPQPNSADWGFISRNGNNTLVPELSQLQYTYSVDGQPNVIVKDYNRAALGGVGFGRRPSGLDELDLNAPTNNQAGAVGSVVSQIYKSKPGRNYKDLGPQPGRY